MIISYVVLIIIVFLTLKIDTNKCKNNFKSRDGSEKKLSNKSSSDGKTNTRRHPYITFMKSSSDYFNNDIV